jgi:hypothetical protein
MFEEAGFRGLNGTWSDALTDVLVIHGSDEDVIARLVEIASSGATHIIANPVLLEGQTAEHAFEVVAEAERRSLS